MTTPKWLFNNKFYAAIIPVNKNSDEEHQVQYHREIQSANELQPGEELLIGSRWASTPHEVHKVFLDIDVEHLYTPSRTSGHAHLILNCNVTKQELLILTEILARLGITGEGNHLQLVNHDQLFLRRQS